jgi:hypothetical protein
MRRRRARRAHLSNGVRPGFAVEANDTWGFAFRRDLHQPDLGDQP